MKQKIIKPNQDQIYYLEEDVLKRMDGRFFNDWSGSDARSNKYIGKMGEIIAADELNCDRPHIDGKKIVPDDGWDIKKDGYKIDVKVQKSWKGYANVNPDCIKKKEADFYMFFHYVESTDEYILKGIASYNTVASSPIVKGRYTDMHAVYTLSWPKSIKEDKLPF